MEQLVSDVDRVVTTTKGHTVAFRAGEPRSVPDYIQSECLAVGCHPSVGKAPDNEPDQPTPQEVAAVMRDIIDESDPDKLTSQGKPKLESISEVLGKGIKPGIRREAERLIGQGEV